jgi:hypothetical protein
MSNLNEKALNEEALSAVVGGANSSAVDEDLKRKEFQTAWQSLNLDQKISGIRRGELYVEWSQGGYQPDALNYLLKIQ